MDLTCFNTSKPFAQNATLLYDDNKNDVNLWKKNGTASLPQCSEPYTFLSQCLLCLLLDSVYVVCNNLTDPVKVKLEYPSDEIPIVKSECPRVQIAADSKDRIGAASGELGTAAIICIVLAILAFIAAAVFLYRRLQQSRRDRNSSTATGPSSSTDINLCDTQVQRVGNGLQEADERLLPTNNNNTVNGAPSTTMLCDDKSVCDTQV